MTRRRWTRREFVKSAGAVAGLSVLGRAAAAWSSELRTVASDHAAHDMPRARPVELTIAPMALTVGGRRGHGIAVNGTIPGPVLRWREGDEAVVRVTNHLEEVTSIHWHGILLPPDMDGVPGVSFAGIAPGETFTYRFPIRQAGTYWAHSHSGLQELRGMYFPLVLEPALGDPVAYDREHVIILSEWSAMDPARVLGKLKKEAGYFNYQRRTLRGLGRDVERVGWRAALADRRAWSRMRMDPTDLADVSAAGVTYLLNGTPSDPGWTGAFVPGERVRLRIINAGALTYFDVRVPGQTLRVVQADGQDVQPVETEELRIAPGETYDAMLEPSDGAHAIVAESLDRSGSVVGTLSSRAGAKPTVAPRRTRTVRTMADMGMAHGEPTMGNEPDSTASGSTGPTPSGHAGHGGAMAQQPASEGGTMPGMTGMAEMAGMASAPSTAANAGGNALPLVGPSLPGGPPIPHGRDDHGPANAQIPMTVRSRADEPGAGLEDMPWRVLTYADLRSTARRADEREPEREVELHLTGNMERFSWSFDGKPYSQAAAPIRFRHGERLRLVLVNDTMMEHPIHLHGMWMELENGGGPLAPRKHTVNVKPAERLTVAITADAPGRWALHCHLLLHMEAGMFRVVEVSAPEAAS